MKILLPTLFISIASFSQGDPGWYKMFTGKIDKYPVTLHIHKSGVDYSGYYYYHSKQQPIYFSGTDTLEKGKISLLAYGDEYEAEWFHFSLAGDKLTGTWRKTEKAGPLALNATRMYMPLQMAYIFSKANKKLRPGWKESPEASIELASVWPQGNKAVDVLVKNIIRDNFSEAKSRDEIGAVFKRKEKEFLDEYIIDNKETSDKDLEEYQYAYARDLTNRVTVSFQSEKLLNLASFYYTYSGGAHGMYGTNHTVIDLAELKVLELDDILDEKGKKILEPLLEKYFRLQYKLKSVESLTEGGLFENKIEPNENFYLTGKGIGFVYQPYEIGPYAMGEINVFIPLQELKDHLRPSAKLLTGFN